MSRSNPHWKYIKNIFKRTKIVVHYHTRSFSYTISRDIRVYVCWFSARDSIYAIARYMLSPVRPSVRPSVCLSVCLSHGWISQRRLKLGSCNFHHRVAHETALTLPQNSTGNIGSGGAEWQRGKKIGNFRPICGRISETVQDRTKITTND